MQGSKIMYMKYKNKRFIDSLSHTSLALKYFAKTFGLDQSQYKKGDFPYTLISENFDVQNYEWLNNMPHIKHFNNISDITVNAYINYITNDIKTPLIYQCGFEEDLEDTLKHYYKDGIIIDDYYHKDDITLIKWYHNCLITNYQWNYKEEL